MLFILGAGASVDSGMKTYRGGGSNGQHYYKFDEENADTNPLHVSALLTEERRELMKQHLQLIADDVAAATLGPTYRAIGDIAQSYDHCLIATQNIDGLAHKTGLEVVELHGSLARNDVVLFGAELSLEPIERVFTFIARHRPSMTYVVGTSFRFTYLRNLIKKAKSTGSKVIHVNPDPDYQWHALRETWYLCPETGEPCCKMVKKRKPETLIKSFF